MGNLSNFSVKKPITILMSVLIIIILGVVSLTRMKTDLLPSINLPYAVVSTQYIGASHEEVELGVTKPLEGQLATVSNIKNIQSISQEHVSIIILEFAETTNMDSVLLEMREKLDMVEGYLPDGVGSPMILKLNPDMMPIMNMSLSFENKTITEATTLIEDEILPRLERIPGVASISVEGTAQNEIHIKLKDAEFAQMEQTIQYMNDNRPAGQPALPSATELIEMMIKGQNISMPIGSVNDQDIDYLVRVGDKLKSIEELRELTIFGTFKLKDVADVDFVNIDDQSYSKVNGEHAITLNVQKQNNYSTTEVAELLNAQLDQIEKDYPEANLVILLDQAEYINLSINSVLNNLIYGGILAVIILFLFLRQIKPTIIIALAIPISVMAAFILIYFSGITLNVISMGGLALGIGMLVDNSIVVIENIYRLRSEGASMREAAVKGASQVAGAIMASTLTTVAVFLPIVFLKGLTADIFKEMALTITYSLGASLVIALTVVPSLSSKMMPEKKEVKKDSFLDKIKAGYTRILKFSLRYKKSTLLVSLVLLVVTAFFSFRVGTEFFPASATTQLSVSVELEEGTRFETTAAALDEVVEKIMTLEDVEYVGASIGGGAMSMLGGGGGTSSGSINVLLKENAKKSFSEVADDIRDLTKDLDYTVNVNESGQDMSAMGGSGISVLVKGQDLEQLEAVATDLANKIAAIRGAVDVSNGVSKTAPELKITVDKDKAAQSGVTVGTVMGILASQLQDAQAISQLNINGREYDIKIPKTTELTLEQIENLPVGLSQAGPVLLKDIADIDPNAVGFGSINRMNQSRYLNVTGSVADGYNTGKVGTEVEELVNNYDTPEGITLEVSGEQEQINSALGDLTLALLLGVVLIYMIMAAQFQSLRYPFIVMFTIPLAFTGGFLGLLITQTPISVVSLIGLIILTGIVVNNGIVLVDYINQLKEEGLSTYDAIIEAGNTRLRPIFMTALTTILALSTMALGIGEGAEMMQPMAITTIGGLLYATLLTLVVVPVIYAGLDRVKTKKIKSE
jgi:multidrug efflux pump subunit AcrB